VIHGCVDGFSRTASFIQLFLARQL
jgi:hypothetical protein